MMTVKGHRLARQKPFIPNGFITFLTDYGTSDSYVAEVKGAILSFAPQAQVVDVTHEVPPQDIRTGAWHLMRAVAAFPAGTVHLAVVDPGVGTSRRAVVVETTSGCVLVGPDNGLLSWASGAGAIWREWTGGHGLPPPRSRTFHGRDLFGPVAAMLASRAIQPSECGPLVFDPVTLPFSRGRRLPSGCSGEVLAVDRFGNVIVGIPGDWVRRTDGTGVRIEVEGRTYQGVIGLYASGASLVVHEDSSGWTEVAVPGGRAADALCIGPGARVTIRWE